MIFFAVLIQSNEDDALACVGVQIEFREVWRFGGVSGGVHIFFFDGWLWLRSGGGGGVFGLLAFQGLEIDQVCQNDAFRHRACLGDDVELFGVCREYVGIDQHFFRGALSDGGVCNGVVHIFGMRNFAPIVKHKVRNIVLCRRKELRSLRNFASSANERYVSRLAEQSIEESWKI